MSIKKYSLHIKNISIVILIGYIINKIIRAPDYEHTLQSSSLTALIVSMIIGFLMYISIDKIERSKFWNNIKEKIKWI